MRVQTVDSVLGGLDRQVADAVRHFWRARDRQSTMQTDLGRSDAGHRGAVTGGAQMDGFLELLTGCLRAVGVPDSSIFTHRDVGLPGFYRPTKQWDLLLVSGGQLVAAMELKSQVGPSFGNNFNNRTEEAVGSATCLWTAFRDGAFGRAPKPWLGYLFLLEDCEASHRPVSVREPHYKVFPEFRGASYARRYEELCRRLASERQYDAAALVLSRGDDGDSGAYTEPAEDLTIRAFVRALLGHAIGHIEGG